MIIDILGYLGSICIVVSFYLVTKGIWKPKKLNYLLTNLIGASLLVAYQINLKAYAGALLNTVFALVAIAGILSYKRSK